MTSIPSRSNRSEPSGTGKSGLFRLSPTGLLGALLLVFVTAPFVEDMAYGDLVEAVIVTLVMVAGVLVVGGRRRVLVVASLLAVPALLGKWINYFWPNLVIAPVFLGLALALMIYVVANLLLYIQNAPQVNTHVLSAGISAYLMLGLGWAVAYVLVSKVSPNAFAYSSGPPAGQTMNAFNAFYFSFTILSTVGFGDIVPTSKLARMLTVVESTTGMFYVAILISRLVSLHTSAIATRAIRGDQNP
jgi:hypothetical protein